MEEASWRRNHGEGIMESYPGGGIMEKESWRRYPGGVILEEESWRRNHGGLILKEESWRRTHGGGALEEESWRRYPGGGIMEEEEESWRMYPGGGIMEEVSCMGEESWRTHLGGIWDASGSIWWRPGCTQQAPRRHPGSTQRDPGHPGGFRGSAIQKVAPLLTKMQMFIGNANFTWVFESQITKYWKLE